jgi:soluble lytic murein transglycosylase-like protein
VLKGMVAAFIVLVAVVGLTLRWSPDSRETVRRLWRIAADPALMARVEGHRDLILAAAAEQDLDPNLIAGIVAAESSGRIDAVSKVGAMGLMQLMPSAAGDAAKKLKLPEPTREQLLTDAELNLRLGARHFAWTLKHEERDIERALVAYNAGRGRLAGWIREAGSYTAWRAEREAAGDSSVLAYARKVQAYAEAFKKRGSFAVSPEVLGEVESGDSAPISESTVPRIIHEDLTDR